jgi:hypothetical protein
MQLQQYSNVDQFAPVQKKFLRTDSPQDFLKEHIIRGDRGDGIPNCLSSDDVLVRGERQKSISKKKLSGWMASDPDDWNDSNQLRGYRRNEQLIDLEFVPQDLKEEILSQYTNAVSGDRSKLFNYFVKFKLKNLMEDIQEF